MPKKHTQSNKVRKRKGRDMDEIQEDMAKPPEKQARRFSPDPDLPGDGQHYCLACDRHFVDADTLEKHQRGKVHKQRLRHLREPIYTQAEADAAGGLGGGDQN